MIKGRRQRKEVCKVLVFVNSIHCFSPSWKQNRFLSLTVRSMSYHSFSDFDLSIVRYKQGRDTCLSQISKHAKKQALLLD